MLKVFATDVLWRIVNDTIQIYGGKAYFTDEPFERMMRDARINMIGEGANDVLRVVHRPGRHARRRPGAQGRARRGQEPAGEPRQARRLRRPQDRVVLQLARRSTCTTGELRDRRPAAGQADRRVRLARSKRVLRTLSGSRCSTGSSNWPASPTAPPSCTSAPACCAGSTSCWARDRWTRPASWSWQTGRYYLPTADRRIRHNLDDLWVNDDERNRRRRPTRC